MSRSLIVRMSDSMGCSMVEAGERLKATLQCIKDEVAQNSRLSLKGFGVFRIEHIHRTSTLNKKVYTIDQNYVKFRTSKRFNEAVRQDEAI